MRKYYCDRCKKELDTKTHAVVEIQRKRYDVCKSPCLVLFEPFRIKVEQEAKESSINLRQRIQQLEHEYWEGVEDGSKKEEERHGGGAV